MLKLIASIFLFVVVNSEHNDTSIIDCIIENCELDISELKGKTLACWCPLCQECHSDVLLELANKKLGEKI